MIPYINEILSNDSLQAYHSFHMFCKTESLQLDISQCYVYNIRNDMLYQH